MTLLTGHQAVYPAYKTLSDAHKWPVLPPERLPGVAAAVTIEGQPVACGWLFRAEAGWSVLEFVFASKSAAADVRAAALDVVLSELIRAAKEAGCKLIFTSTAAPTLIDRYQKFGFGPPEPGNTNLLLRL